MDTFTETSTAPDEAVAAVNLSEQGQSSISEAVFHPGLTAMQQHIVGDLVSSARENGNNFKIHNNLNDGLCASIKLKKICKVNIDDADKSIYFHLKGSTVRSS